MERPATSQNDGGDEDQRDRVESLLIECLDRAETEGQDAIEDVCTRHPEHADALRRQLATLAGLGLFAGQPRRDSAGIEIEQIGEFRLLRKLGEGGMAVVYLAEQTSLRRLVALKVLRSGIGSAPGLTARFEREALTIARLRHPNIVTLHAAGEEAGLRYLAMELVPGRGLDEILAEAAQRSGSLPIPQVVQWGRDLARALESAHGAGIVHRDVKPSNVRITPDGRAMLLDFGLARDLETPGLTRTGEFQGSPHYASPEQVGGGTSAIGPATDVYSLGVTLYEAATGVLPFAGQTMEQLFQRILAQEPVRARRLNPGVPRDLETVLLRAMEKDSRRRYPTAKALADDLDAILELRPIAAQRSGSLVRLGKWARRQPAAAAAVMTSIVAALVFVGILIVQAASARDRASAEARAALVEAKRYLDAFRQGRSELAGAEQRVAILKKSLEYNYLDPRQDEQLDFEEAAVERGRREREMALVQVLALLQRAEGLEPDNSQARQLRTELYAEKFDEAANALDAGLASFYRDLVLSIDAGGAAARRVTGRIGVSFTTTPASAQVHLFRYAALSELGDGGEPRLVPVPVGDPSPAVPPGTWCLAVVRGAGTIRAGDLIVEVAGHPIRGTMFASVGDAEFPEPLVASDGRPVRDAYDAEAMGLRGLSPAEVCERGGVTAKIYHAGTMRSEQLPRGLGVRTTAAPLLVSTATVAGITPTPAIALETGSYLALLRHEDCEDLRLPFVVGPGRPFHWQLTMNPKGTTPPGFVHIPPRHESWLHDEFWIQEREVTAGEYLEFVNDPATLQAIQSSPVQILVPREPPKPMWPSLADGSYALAPPWTPEWPVLGISHGDAEAYARWRTERAQAAGVPFGFALPTFDEWKSSGHGADGRDYVFGWVFRPKWMKSNYARPVPDPEPVLRFPVDESVFGAFDQSGSVLEWLDDWYHAGERRRAAGGGWGQADPRSYFTVEGGVGLPPEAVANLVGFRLVARRRPR